MMINALDHLVLTVRDVEASAAWYERVLGMRRETFTGMDNTTRTALRFGTQKINLHSADAPFAPHARTPLPGTADVCFLTATPLADVLAHFAACGVPLVDGPVKRTGANGPLLSVYVRDLDGNLIEVSQT